MEGGFLYDNPKLLVKRRSENEVNSQILNGIKTISKNIKNVSPFGSWIYQSQLYPGDVDMVELEERSGDIKKAIDNFVIDTQRIVQNIINSKGYYIGDIKAGIDRAYIIDIGKVVYDNVGNVKIIGYNPDHIYEQIGKQLIGIMPLETLNELKTLIHPTINLENYEKLYGYLREKWLLRWTEEEILEGYKILDGNRKITLGEAINMPVMTKIDMWTSINGIFLEFSNVITYVVYDKEGNRVLLNFQNKDFIDNLRREVQKYAFSFKEFKPFKMVKRMWSLARMMKDYDMIEKLTPLMQTDFGRLSQMASEMETLILILSNVRSPPIKKIMKQIDNYKWRIGNIFEIKINKTDFIEAINDLLNNEGDKKYMIENLNKLRKSIIKKVSNVTLGQLEKLNLWPPPQNYLPGETSVEEIK